MDLYLKENDPRQQNQLMRIIIISIFVLDNGDMVSKSSQKQLETIVKKTAQLANKSVPVWMVGILMLNSSLGVGFLEYYIVKQNLATSINELSQVTNNSNQLIQILKEKVLPQSGYQLGVTWGDIGKQLLDSGVIDKQKFEQTFAQEPDSLAMMKYMKTSSKDHMMINEKNSHFMVNMLWALGLVNKNDVLDNGTIKTYGQGDPMQFASTGGWNLGSKDTKDLYSSTPIIQLTDKQEVLVKQIAANIFRACCSNPTSFPDCNHGMAALGYIELAVKQGLSEKRIYQDVLALNSFWFPQQYVTLAAYFNQQKTDWKNVDTKLVLSEKYSSGQGMQQIQQETQNIPGLNQQQGGCGA